MAEVLTLNDTLAELLHTIEKLSEVEQRRLLIQLNAAAIVKNPPKLIDKPIKISMAEINNWKNKARKEARSAK